MFMAFQLIVSSGREGGVILRGLILARQDPSQGTVDFLPTGVTEDHFFAGINLEGEAVFIKPQGGLVLVPIH